VTLAPTYSVITDIADYNGATLHNTGNNPTVLSQYCNGARVPPENGGLGYDVPPGISDATVPNPIFNLTPAATVDEGNNWINISWGPLALTNPTGTLLGNYGPAAGSSVINLIPSSATTQYNAAPAVGFYGTPRKTNNAVDAGAVEFAGSGGGGGGGTPASVTITPNPLLITVATPFLNAGTGTGIVTLTNTGAAGGASVTVSSVAVASGTGSSALTWFFNAVSNAVTPGSDTCTGTTLAPGATCKVTVRFTNVTSATGVNRPGTITFTDTGAGSPQVGVLTGHANP